VFLQDGTVVCFNSTIFFVLAALMESAMLPAHNSAIANTATNAGRA
jgi:hypothetical protein